MKRLQSPFITMPLWAVVGALIVVLSPRSWLAVIGACTWPIVEYAAHRWTMHGLARVAPRLYKRIHGVHHLYPRDLSHFVIPVPVVVLIAAILGAALVLLGVGLAPLGGLLLAFVVYDLAHLAAHNLAPFPFATALRNHHKKHHENDTINFGVTSPWIDQILHTDR